MLEHNQLKAIEILQKQCEENDAIQLKLNWDMLKSKDTSGCDTIQYYENGELVGYIGMYGFGSKVELCGMVKPYYRRQGIFSMLLDRALKLVSHRKYRNVLLNAPANSVSAKGFLQKTPCTFSFTEYQMKWAACNLVSHTDIALRQSVPDDFETEVQLDVSCFGFLEAEARRYNERMKQDHTQQFYMIENNAKTVGKLRVDHTDGEAWIYGFAIFPEYQGKGIGRKALTNIVIHEHKHGYAIFLDVEATNSHALRLYESCGFETYHAQDYYQLEK